MSAAKDKFSLCSLLRLSWETELASPQIIRRSPVFTFVNCEWYLELRQIHASCSDYDLFMVLTKEQQYLPKFVVKTCFFHPLRKTEPLFCNPKAFTSSEDWIAFISASRVKNYLSDGRLAIECVIEEIDSSTDSFKSGEQFRFKTESSSTVTKDQIISFEKLSEDLEAMLDNTIVPDLQLVVGETSIPCHRAVLASRSKVFAAMFKHRMTESASGVLEIKDIDLSTIKAFLKYLYSGRIPSDSAEDMLLKLFEIGDKYKVDVLKKLCSSELLKNINDENCLSYLSLAAARNDQEFKDAVAAYIVKDDMFMSSQDWIQFSSENLKLSNEVYGKYFETKDRKRRKVN